jgi:adenosine deaminase
VSADDLERLPKVVLHEHLDGGLRPQTVIDLAAAAGYDGLPHQDPESLAAWFYQGDAVSLDAYLAAFAQTIAVMQSPEAIRRVAYESAQDLAADGVVYAEVRFAPSLHLRGGMTRRDVLEAAIAGFAEAEADFGLPTRILVDAMRQHDDSADVARAAVEFAGRGVVGFDLAGPEEGNPAASHRSALRIASEGGLRITIHAGEGAGVDSIRDALESGAERIGHGARIIEDTTVVRGAITQMGPVADAVLRNGVALELCPTSNLNTGMYRDAADHPIGLLHRAGFSVTINTDNRLMSATSMTDEFRLVVDHHGFGLDDLRVVTRNAIDAAFCDETTRDAARARIEAGY